MLHNRKVFLKRACATFIGLLCIAQPISAKLIDHSIIRTSKSKNDQSDLKSWQKVYSPECKCNMVHPSSPEHIKQKMPMANDPSKELRYDVYVSDYERKEVFMVLIAQYPGVVDREYAVKNFELFLNSILAQNPKNQLVFADLIDVQGYPAMDFFIRTEQVYFKGRAIQAENMLYILAMEAEVSNHQEHHLDHFVGSFELLHENAQKPRAKMPSKPNAKANGRAQKQHTSHALVPDLSQ